MSSGSNMVARRPKPLGLHNQITNDNNKESYKTTYKSQKQRPPRLDTIIEQTFDGTVNSKKDPSTPDVVASLSSSKTTSIAVSNVIPTTGSCRNGLYVFKGLLFKVLFASSTLFSLLKVYTE